MLQIVEITELSMPELDVYLRLTDAQLRSKQEKEKGIIIAESPHVIEHALNAGCVPISFLMERKKLDSSKQLLERCNVPVYTAARDILCALTGYELTRGILCAMHRPLPMRVQDVVENAQRVAVLEGIVDAANMGALFRSAAALGMDAVLLSPNCCDALCRRTMRVSMGTVFQIPWARMDGEWFAFLKKQGFKTAAMALCDRSISIAEPVLKKQDKLAIVLGTEGSGLRQETISACDYVVRIPMAHGVDSLNVAAAGAVAFWQLGLH